MRDDRQWPIRAGQSRAEQRREKSRAEQARLFGQLLRFHNMATEGSCVSGPPFPPRCAPSRARFRLMHEKTSNSIEYFGAGWVRSSEGPRAMPAVAPFFLYPVTLHEAGASSYIYLPCFGSIGITSVQLTFRLSLLCSNRAVCSGYAGFSY